MTTKKNTEARSSAKTRFSSSIRPLEQQFEPRKVEAIRKIQEDLYSEECRNCSHGSILYYIKEISSCLEAGLLLSALETSMSALELCLLILRESILTEGEDSQSSYTTQELLNALENSKVLEKSEIKQLHKFYSNVNSGNFNKAKTENDQDVIAVKNLLSIAYRGDTNANNAHEFDLEIERRAISDLSQSAKLLKLLTKKKLS